MSATATSRHTHSTSAAARRSLDHVTPLSAALGVARLAMGWIFLWPFLDKTFGLGHETTSADAWINGGSPTAGFLGNATSGPFSSMYESFAGQAWADWFFMLGLLGIGSGLILGVVGRLVSAAGVTLLVLMWSAVLPPANNPFLDDHLVYALLLVILAIANAGETFGLARFWDKLSIVRRHPVLR
jgi:thiosulfate dehydrogenase [quinone] large subunit